MLYYSDANRTAKSQWISPEETQKEVSELIQGSNHKKEV